MNTGRPLLYLDVDGPLNPYAAKPERRPEGYTTHRMKPEGWLAQHPGLPRPASGPSGSGSTRPTARPCCS